MDALDPSLPQCVVRTLVLTDLENSTALTERLGDQGTAAVIAQHDRLARSLLAEHEGQEIDKSDGFLLLFEDPVDAMAWCLSYHRRLAELGERLGLPLAARAGMHVGEVVTWKNPPDDVARGAKPVEVEGIAKPVAARVMSAGGGGQTLLTTPAWDAITRAKLDPRLRGVELGWVELGPYAFKGVSEPVELFEVGEPGIAPLAPPPGSGKVRPWTSPNNLPEGTTRFVGREAELAELDGVLAQHRLVTLLGPGGTGKTRLSIEAARVALPRYPGGAWFCEVEHARDRAAFCAGVAHALDVHLTSGDPVELLGAAIAGRGRTLIVLDNLEQVVAEAAQVLSVWIEAAPEARFLGSSREALQIAHEERFPLDSLTDEAAVALFVDRAAAVRRGFALTEDNRADIVALVKELDGLPLAIELAAARARMLAPKAILQRLTRRFDLLKGKRRDVADRQATLLGAIDWSWDLLQGWERLALAQCSVFVGGFDVEAAEEVLDLSAFPDAEWTMDVCEALVDKSLLRSVEGGDGSVRLSMYASIHAYAARKLADANGLMDPDGSSCTGPDAVAAAEARHAAFYARLGDDDALAALHGVEGLDQLRLLSRELPNLRTAVERGTGEDAGRAALAASEIFQIQGPFPEAARLLAAARRRPGVEGDLAARVQAAEGFLRKLAGERQRAGDLLEGALELLRGGSWEAHTQQLLGHLRRDEGQIDEADACLEAAIDGFRAQDDAWGEAVSLGALAALHLRTGKLDQAQALNERALTLLREVGALRSRAHVLGSLAVVHAMRGDIGQAAPMMEEALGLHATVGNRRSQGLVSGNLGFLRYEQGRFEEAAELLAQALHLAREVGNRGSERTALTNLAVVRRAQKAPMEAQSLAQSALALAEAAGSRRDQARAHAELGNLALDDEQLGTARAHATTGLTMAREARAPRAIVVLLGILGELEARDDLAAGLVHIDEAIALVEKARQDGPLASLLLRRVRVLRRAGLDAAEELERAATLIEALGRPATSPLARELAAARG